MNTPTPDQILQEIGRIKQMEAGKVCVIRKGAKGAYYNHQYRENGKPVSRYVPGDQVETLTRNTANYQAFQALVGEYAQAVIQTSREERLAGAKKKTRQPSASSSRKNSKS
jgi:hypothetical protein